MAQKGSINTETTVRLAHEKDQERTKVMNLKLKHDAFEKKNQLFSGMSADGKTTFFASTQEKVNQSISKYNQDRLIYKNA